MDVSTLGYDFGSAQAPLQVVEFGDFGCGYCRQFRLETFPSLSEEFIETGQIAWKYVPFVLGMFTNGKEAATAGECAGEQGAFDPMSIRLFRDQAEWKHSEDPDAVFRRFAEEEGLDVTRFAACVREGWRSDRLDAANRTAFQLGVRGTPTFFIDAYPISGALPLPAFRDFLANVLRERADRAR